MHEFDIVYATESKHGVSGVQSWDLDWGRRVRSDAGLVDENSGKENDVLVRL